MRKVILILCCILLVACQEKNGENKPEASDNPSQKENLVLKEWKYLINEGDGNDDGYYRLSHNDDGETYLLYTDYSTGQEIYLCNKPECQHKDESCTSYLPFGDISEMFVYKDHLYFIESAGAIMQLSGDGLVSSMKSTPHIYQMDLDGQNRKELCQLEEGYQFTAGNIALDGHDMYLSISKNDDVETSKNSHMQVTTQNELFKINLKTGQKEKVMDLYDGLSDKDIAAVEGRKLILSGYYCQEDPQKYLDKKDFSGYDRIMEKSKSLYEIVNIDTLKKETIKTKEVIPVNYYQNKIYYTDKNFVYCFDLATKKISEFLSLDKGYEYSLDIYGHQLLINQWKGDKFQKTLISSIDKPKIKELKQHTRAPKEPVNIISMTSDKVFVLYDREGDYEKTWAGTMQYETKKEYKGLISIDDFFNNKKNYQKMSVIQ